MRLQPQRLEQPGVIERRKAEDVRRPETRRKIRQLELDASGRLQSGDNETAVTILLLVVELEQRAIPIRISSNRLDIVERDDRQFAKPLEHRWIEIVALS